MVRIEMKELIDNGLARAVELMAVAAYNAIKFSDRNTIKIVALGKDDMELISEFCFSLGDMSPLGSRDGRALQAMMKEPMAMMVIGDKRKSDFNYNCGACGYKTCAELNKSELVEALTSNGPYCLFKSINLHMAANAAAAMAWQLGLQCRVFSTFGFGAKSMEVMSDIDTAVAVPVSVAKRDPYFDRHQYWTKEHWDAIFEKEFPTFVRGFIGAIEE
ncbi:MAG TPA: DUF2148 domain-containing protein [Spirochaetota bacterium]|nr:DUF2148 domain-containing protein [Spirochaetota bacterium]